MRKSPAAWLVLALVSLVACASKSGSSGYSSGSGSGGGPAPGGSTSPDPTVTPGDYPPGPYGLDTTMTFPSVSFQGYVGGQAPWTTIALKDYYDPDGTKGIRGIYLTGSAPWCAACVSEAKSFPARFANEYKAKGARFVTAILQDDAHGPATRGTVDDWVKTFGTNYDIVLDPTFSILKKDSSGGGSAALPYNYVIDPRTMKVTQINAGPYFFGGGIPGLDELLAKNAE